MFTLGNTSTYDPPMATPDAGASTTARLDLFRDEVWHDPHPQYHQLRASTPVMPGVLANECVLFRHADCEAVLADRRWSSNPEHRTASDELFDVRLGMAGSGAAVLLFLDPPDHTRLRRLVSKAFTPRRVEEMRPTVAALVDAILDHVEAQARAGDGTVDLMAELCYPLPVKVICDLLGTPFADRPEFIKWSSDASRILDAGMDPSVLPAALMGAMAIINELNPVFEERKLDPADDLISALVAAEEEGDRLSEGELRSITVLLFIAGHETTQNLIGNGLHAMLRQRDQWRALAADPDGCASAAVEEALRYDGPVHATVRVATEDLTVGSADDGTLTEIRTGGQAVCLLAAANRDPAVFTDPDRFDLARDDAAHLAFSHGMHYCLGAALARLEGQEAFRALARRFPDLALAEEPEYRDHRILRGLRTLRVRL
jgi:cytochrome P450